MLILPRSPEAEMSVESEGFFTKNIYFANETINNRESTLELAAQTIEEPQKERLTRKKINNVSISSNDIRQLSEEKTSLDIERINSMVIKMSQTKYREGMYRKNTVIDKISIVIPYSNLKFSNTQKFTKDDYVIILNFGAYSHIVFQSEMFSDELTVQESLCAGILYLYRAGCFERDFQENIEKYILSKKTRNIKNFFIKYFKLAEVEVAFDFYNEFPLIVEEKSQFRNYKGTLYTKDNTPPRLQKKGEKRKSLISIYDRLKKLGYGSEAITRLEYRFSKNYIKTIDYMDLLSKNETGAIQSLWPNAALRTSILLSADSIAFPESLQNTHPFLYLILKHGKQKEIKGGGY